jgi:hypothetical protein
MKFWILKAKIWRIYYWLFTDRFKPMSLKEILNEPYEDQTEKIKEANLLYQRRKNEHI